LPTPRLALEEQRPLHGEREVERGGEAAVGYVLAFGEQRLGFVDRLRKGLGHEGCAFSGI
jgi:hypothetical protein